MSFLDEVKILGCLVTGTFGIALLAGWALNRFTSRK